MAQSTEFRNPTLPQAQTGGLEGGLERVWEKIKLAILRTVLWAYERGTWQYDLLVFAILAFIFLSPRGWFNDRPTLELTDLGISKASSKWDMGSKDGATLWTQGWWNHTRLQSLRTPSRLF